MSLIALKKEFSKMADVGNIEEPESSSSAPTSKRKFENFGLSKSNFFEIFRTFL